MFLLIDFSLLLPSMPENLYEVSPRDFPVQLNQEKSNKLNCPITHQLKITVIDYLNKSIIH